MTRSHPCVPRGIAAGTLGGSQRAPHAASLPSPLTLAPTLALALALALTLTLAPALPLSLPLPLPLPLALPLPLSQTPLVPGRLLPRLFYSRDALEVARDLLGREIWHGGVGLRITEVEAYRYPDDSANHCRAGLTSRNAPMWGPPGHAYVYLCYGLHQMLNLVTNRDGEGAAVLIRSCEPVAGHRTIRRRRGGKDGPVLLTGPGKVGQALGLDAAFSGHPLYRRGGLEVREGARASHIVVGSRIGIGYADPDHQNAQWRLAIAGSPWVSHARQLRGAR